jgi:hypothetical protein
MWMLNRKKIWKEGTGTGKPSIERIDTEQSRKTQRRKKEEERTIQKKKTPTKKKASKQNALLKIHQQNIQIFRTADRVFETIRNHSKKTKPQHNHNQIIALPAKTHKRKTQQRQFEIDITIWRTHNKQEPTPKERQQMELG